MDRQLSNGAVTTVHYTVSANDGTYSSGAVWQRSRSWIFLKTIRN